MRVGFPVDAVQWIAVALSVAAAVFAPQIAKPSRRPALFVGAAALAAALLSAIYIAIYLRGGPRIIDATSYWLEARALSEGLLRFPIDEPTASTLGRFLVRSDAPEGPGAAVIFPPGYPALLAIGFLVGSPLVVGPILAAALVVTTYALGEQAAESLRSAPDRVQSSDAPLSVGQIAAVLSVVCGALRYHTADTMSHGLSALCFSGSLTLTLRALSLGSTRRSSALAAFAGLSLGWLAATRPVTSMALSMTLAALITLERSAPWRLRARLAALIALGAIPGLALLAAHQRAATGALFSSSQTLYYALSDGPSGCFRYGFGANIGCVGEHGDFVQAYMPNGYGAIEALRTTLRRLTMHLVDAGNAEPLAFLVPLGAALGQRSTRVRLLVTGVALVVAAYVPFYFDGNYPGGGARFFADVLPLEHVLIAVAAVVIAERARAPRSPSPRLAGSVVALSLAAFAVRAGFDHAALRDREGGLPMFEPARLTEAGVARGLVFLDTDHGFNLAFDPAAGRPNTTPNTLQFARFRGDSLDRMAWEARGRPPAYRYFFRVPDDGGVASVAVEPIDLGAAPSKPPGAEPLSIEGEGLWPAIAQDRAFALPAFASGTCASGWRILAAHAPPQTLDSKRNGPPPSVLVSLPAAWLRGRVVAPTIATSEGATGVLTLILDGAPARSWHVTPTKRDDGSPTQLICTNLDGALIPPGTRDASIRIAPSSSNFREADRAVFALDKVDASPEVGEPGREND